MVGKILRKSPLTVMDGGFASFSNVELSGGKKIVSAVKTVSDGRTSVTVSFEDGNIYIFDCIKISGENIPTSLTDIKEYWNGLLLHNEEEENEDEEE